MYICKKYCTDPSPAKLSLADLPLVLFLPDPTNLDYIEIAENQQNKIKKCFEQKV